jgi:hypothetical protein
MAIVLKSPSRRTRAPGAPHRLACAAIATAAFGFFATPASAQVSFLPGDAVGDFHAICHLGGSLVLTQADDCDTPVDLYPEQITGIYIGSGDKIVLDGPTGNATFNAAAQFNGQVSMNGFTQIGQVNSGSINNSGVLNTGSINNQGALLQTGNARFNGSVTMDGFYANAGTIGTLNTSLATASSLTITAGGQLNLSGNRIQNVGAPVAGTDAANKNYVDNAVGNIAGSVTSLTNQVNDQGARITAVEATNAQQDNRLTAVENANTVQDGRITSVENTNIVQDTRLDAVETQNGTQNTRLTSIENVNVAQDSRMTAIEAVNTIQSNQISTLQDRVGGLETSVLGLRRNIQQANGGIAAAVALGGTMVVPDSNVSLSFNLATYRGQQGFSGAVVGRIAPKIYVNAGIGGSTVRKSTAGRVGISFGL